MLLAAEQLRSWLRRRGVCTLRMCQRGATVPVEARGNGCNSSIPHAGVCRCIVRKIVPGTNLYQHTTKGHFRPSRLVGTGVARHEPGKDYQGIVAREPCRSTHEVVPSARVHPACEWHSKCEVIAIANKCCNIDGLDVADARGACVVPLLAHS